MSESNDDWRRVPYLVEIISADLGISIGKAQAIVIEAGASGEVRSRTFGLPIHPASWRNVIINLAWDELISDTGKLTARPELNWNDLRPWLERHYSRSGQLSAHEPASRLEPSTQKRSAGRRSEYDWDEARQFFEREYERRGDFRKPENQVEGWRSITDAAKAVMAHLERHGGKCPDESTARRRVSIWLEEFEKRETEQSAHN